MAEFYEKAYNSTRPRLQVAHVCAEKIQGMKDAEQMMRDTLKYQVELQKTQMFDTSGKKAAGTTAASRIDATLFAATSRKYVADAYKDTRDKEEVQYQLCSGGFGISETPKRTISICPEKEKRLEG